MSRVIEECLDGRAKCKGIAKGVVRPSDNPELHAVNDFFILRSRIGRKLILRAG
jgi:hypothetical protein